MYDKEKWIEDTAYQNGVDPQIAFALAEVLGGDVDGLESILEDAYLYL